MAVGASAKVGRASPPGGQAHGASIGGFFVESGCTSSVAELAEKSALALPASGLSPGRGSYPTFMDRPSGTNFVQTPNLIKAEAVDVLQPDICNAGGITELKKIAAIAESQHLSMAPHNTDSPVGTVAAFHLGAAVPNFLIQEYHAEFYEPWFFDLCPEQPRRTGPSVPLPTGPGLGITLDESVARAHPLIETGGWHKRGI